MIQTINLSKTYSIDGTEIKAVQQVNLHILAGSFNFIIGPSGSGKSTLLHLLGALDRPTQGQVVIAGQDLNMLTDYERSLFRREKIGFIFQSFNLISDLTVLENVLIPLLPKGIKDSDRERAKSLLKSVGLGERLRHKATKISGGEEQRVAIARALIKQPLIILADEPTGELDTKSASEILNIFRQINREQNTTLFIVTHDTRFIQPTDKVYKMEDGRIGV